MPDAVMLDGMSPILAGALLVLFLVHLAAFARLGLKRREPYYLALVVTFALLSAAFATLLLAPQAMAGSWPLHRVFRVAAWAAAAVSISWTVARAVRRRRR